MPIFIKSAIPGLPTRTAWLLQIGLVAIVAALVALPRDPDPASSTPATGDVLSLQLVTPATCGTA